MIYLLIGLIVGFFLRGFVKKWVSANTPVPTFTYSEPVVLDPEDAVQIVKAIETGVIREYVTDRWPEHGIKRSGKWEVVKSPLPNIVINDGKSATDAFRKYVAALKAAELLREQEA
jgi:hypothetical protein